MQGYANIWQAHFDGEFIKANARTAWHQYNTQRDAQIKLKRHNDAYEFIQEVGPTDGFLKVMRINNQTHYLYANHVARVDAGGKRDTVNFPIGGYPQDVVFSPSGNYVLKMGEPPYEQYKWVNAGIGKKTVKKTVDVVKDAASFIHVGSLKRSGYIEYPMNYAGSYHTGVSVTDDGKYFFDSPSVYEAQTGAVVFTLPGDEIQTRVYTSMFNKAGTKLFVFHQNSIVKCFEVPSGKLLNEFKGRTREVIDTRFSKDETSIFVLNKDASVQRWDANSGNLIVTYYPFEGDNYAVVWSDHYYMMSPMAYKHLHYVNGLKTIGFENFDLVFNRPDIITKRSGTKDQNLINAYYKAYVKRTQKMGFTESQISKEMKLPNLKLKTTDLPLKTAQENIEISFEASGNGIPIDRLNVYVNNVPLFGMRGKAITKGLMNLDDKVIIPLSAGKNKIEVSVHNAGGYESPRQVFNIAKEGTVKPDLYVVAIGVSDYKDNNYDLTYAAKDAQDLIKAYQSRTEQYNKITVLDYTDAKAIKENILKSKEILMKSKVDDQVVLFVAGHGLVDAKLDYYFATHDVNFMNPALRGLPYDALEGLLDGIPARKKLMLIDACHSGEIDKEESQVLASAAGVAGVKSRGFKTVAKKSVGLDNSFDVMNEIFADLRRGTGAVVISSASGVEFAYESEQWKNGVFTYSILQAFSTLSFGGVDANHSRSLEVSELKDFVIENVHKLTNGKQHPTSRRENLEFDFVVW
jgi:WD40 repeat protein